MDRRLFWWARGLLPRLMVKLTGAAREIPLLHWQYEGECSACPVIGANGATYYRSIRLSRHGRFRTSQIPKQYNHLSRRLWTHNVMRAYEQVFGRRWGLRKESATTLAFSPQGIIPGSIRRRFYTNEARVAYAEGVVRREAVRAWQARVAGVPAPAFALGAILLLVAGVGLPPAVVGGLEKDTATSDPTPNSQQTSITTAHTNSGSQLTTLAGATVDNSGLPSGITYAGDALTKYANNGSMNGGNTTSSIWRKVSPQTGTNNCISSFTSSHGTLGVITFSGSDTGSPATTSAGANGTGTSVSVGITTVNDYSYVLDCVYQNNGNEDIVVDGGQTEEWREFTGVSEQTRGLGSTEEKATAGAVTMSWTITGGNTWATTAVEIKAAVAASHRMFLAMG